MNWLKQVFGEDFTLTKRMIGILMVIVGMMGCASIFAFDAISGGDQFGPSQKLALFGAMATLFIGASLIPLGDSPA